MSVASIKSIILVCVCVMTRTPRFEHSRVIVRSRWRCYEYPLLISVLERFDPDYKLQKSFSNNCVTIKTPSSLSRIKVYNKVTCNLKSPGVCSYFGSNLLNYVNCSDERLRRSFEETVEEGLIRVEVTTTTLEKGIEVLKQVKNYLNSDLAHMTLYFTPDICN